MLNLKFKGLTKNKLRKVHKKIQVPRNEQCLKDQTPRPPTIQFPVTGSGLATCGSMLLAHLVNWRVGSLLGKGSSG